MRRKRLYIRPQDSTNQKAKITVLSLRLVGDIVLLTGSRNTTMALPSSILSVPPTVRVHLMHLSAARSSTNLSLLVSSIISELGESPPRPCALPHRVCLVNG
ncbi:hypothetical protein PMIN02_008729 [Paraphaeosphaeria minitans]